MYLSDIERNCKIVRLRATEFNALFVSDIGVAETCGNWQLLGEIVDRLFSRAINGDSNVAC